MLRIEGDEIVHLLLDAMAAGAWYGVIRVHCTSIPR